MAPETHQRRSPPPPPPSIGADPTTTVDRGTTGTGPGAATTTVAPVAAGSSGGSSWPGLALIGALVVAVLYVLLAPRAVAAWTSRERRSPRDRVVGAWYRTCHALTLAGAPPIGGDTPQQYASLAGEATGVDPQMLRELADRVTIAIYAPVPVTTVEAEACERIEHDIDSLCRPRTPWATRLREAVDPRWMVRRATG